MKIKLYLLHCDTPKNGIELRVFTSNAKRLAHMKSIMLAAIQTATENAATRNIRRLLKKKNIKGAWFVWRDLIDDHYYTRYEETITVPAKVEVEIVGGVAYVTQCTKGIDVKLTDHDNH